MTLAQTKKGRCRRENSSASIIVQCGLKCGDNEAQKNKCIREQGHGGSLTGRRDRVRGSLPVRCPWWTIVRASQISMGIFYQIRLRRVCAMPSPMTNRKNPVLPTTATVLQSSFKRVGFSISFSMVCPPQSVCKDHSVLILFLQEQNWNKCGLIYLSI